MFSNACFMNACCGNGVSCNLPFCDRLLCSRVGSRPRSRRLPSAASTKGAASPSGQDMDALSAYWQGLSLLQFCGASTGLHETAAAVAEVFQVVDTQPGQALVVTEACLTQFCCYGASWRSQVGPWADGRPAPGVWAICKGLSNWCVSLVRVVCIQHMSLTLSQQMCCMTV